MKRNIVRQCKGCKNTLSLEAHHNQKYCSAQCRQREKVRRFRQRRDPKTQEQTHRLEDIESDFEQLKVHYEKQTERLAERDLTIRRLEHALNRAEHQVEVVADEQAQRTHDVRQQLATANSEVAALRRNWSVRADADMAGPAVRQLRDQLSTVTGQYQELVAKYRELTEAAQYAANERKHLQGIVRQWDSMCVRLYKATGGRPRRESDKQIMATWTKFRKLVSK